MNGMEHLTAEQRQRVQSLTAAQAPHLEAIKVAAGSLIRNALLEKANHAEFAKPSTAIRLTTDLVNIAVFSGINSTIVKMDDSGELDFFKKHEEMQDKASPGSDLLSRLFN